MSVFGSLHDKSKISSFRTTIETAFYRNNVERVFTPADSYRLALKCPGTIVTDQPINNPEYHGLPDDAKVLLFNDGEVTGRCAQARRISGTSNVDEKTYTSILREAVYNARFRKMYHAVATIGLHEDMMVKANILIPEGFENNLLSWNLNFQHLNEKYKNMYKRSVPYDDTDIFIFTDPYWSHPDFPLGLAFFDSQHNVAALLGLRYFGEFKKATLTLGWGTAKRHGFVACHGGIKRFNHNNFIAAFFGLSGSGKSTLTHAQHGGKYNITVLHDDAFVINLDDISSIALEPSYFDKTADYVIGHPDNKYILTAQNIGASKTEDGRLFFVLEDIRQGNGRAVKSDLWSPHRVDKFDKPINAIFWLMKDPTLPPISRLVDPSIASLMGLTLATKRTSAERVVGQDLNQLVFEPYANPFRVYPLADDYDRFKKLIEKGVSCYILNTGEFMGKDIPKELTLSLLEQIIEDEADFMPWPEIEEFSYLPVDGYEPDMQDVEYRKSFKNRMKDRYKFIETCHKNKKHVNYVPEECLDAMRRLLAKL
ncbi:MAG: phosphoenolpyruvate carboxykinase (ATP) [Candidatus Zixiibacteriota bacterium]